MEKNIKEIKETIKADFVNSRAIIENYETSDGTIYMKKTIVKKQLLDILVL